MNQRGVRLFLLTGGILSLLSAVGFGHYTTVAQEPSKLNTFAGDKMLNGVESYRQWTRVNDIPLPVIEPLLNGAMVASTEIAI